MKPPSPTQLTLSLLSAATIAGAGLHSAQADQVFLDDVIIDGSACIGFDCVNGESFGFDTLRLKENNLRIKFQDTSSTASFPTQDWQLTANDSTNGGQNKFSIDAVAPSSSTPFTIEAGSNSHSLYVDDGGRLGLGTNQPVVDVHVVNGNTPTLRLEQDGSSGFTPQTWDVAGNEANFFVRDATGGSTLPFRLFPGAPSNALTIEGSTGDIGIGTTSPENALHVFGSSTASVQVDTDLLADAVFLDVNSDLAAQIRMIGDTQNRRVIAIGGDDVIDTQIRMLDSSIVLQGATDSDEFATFDASGISVGGMTLNVPDYVFAPEYDLMPLGKLQSFITENSHLPNVPSANEVNEGGLNMTEMQLKLLEKIEELTLYTLQQQKELEELRTRLEQSEK